MIDQTLRSVTRLFKDYKHNVAAANCDHTLRRGPIRFYASIELTSVIIIIIILICTLIVTFQILTDEEYERAHKRAFPPVLGPDPYQQFSAQLNANGYPRMLAVGDSHITPWATYSRSKRAITGDRIKLLNSRFVGVGGAKYCNVVNWIQGINLPPHKRKLGNQWQELVNTGFDPQFIFVSIGSNSVDDADRKAKSLLKRYRHYPTAQAKIKKEMAKLFVEFNGQQRKLVRFIRLWIPNSRLCYLYITPRPWWSHYARELASTLDYYMTRFIERRVKVYTMKELYVNERKNMTRKAGFIDNIIKGLTDADHVHLNRLGYHIVTRKVMVSLTDTLYRN